MIEKTGRIIEDSKQIERLLKKLLGYKGNTDGLWKLITEAEVQGIIGQEVVGDLHFIRKISNSVRHSGSAPISNHNFDLYQEKSQRMIVYLENILFQRNNKKAQEQEIHQEDLDDCVPFEKITLADKMWGVLGLSLIILIAYFFPRFSIVTVTFAVLIGMVMGKVQNILLYCITFVIAGLMWLFPAIVGAAAGVATGTATGAAFGSVVPFIGTAVGAVAGGVIGSMLAGAVAGEKLGGYSDGLVFDGYKCSKCKHTFN